MPTHTPMADAIIPQKAEAPIPVRTVTTRPVKAAESNQTVQSTPAAEPAPTSVTLSPTTSAKARQEQAYREREAVLKQRETDFADKLKLVDRYSALEAKLQAKDYSAVKDLGIDYAAYTDYVANGQVEEAPETKALKSMETEIANLKKGQEEQADREYQATVKEYDKEIKSLVASDPELSSIKALGREDAVLQLFLDEWEGGNEDITVEQCAKDVEEFLVNEAKQYTALPKLKPEERKLPKPGLKTLTQQVSVGATPPSNVSLSRMSDAERYAEARRRALAKRQG
jgi:hypothetical protein